VGLNDLARSSSAALREGGLPLLASKASSFVGDRAALLTGGRLLRRELSAATTIAGSLDVVYEFRYGRISVVPTQIRSEIARLLEFLTPLRPRAVLEIGTGLGGTFILFGAVASDDARLVTLDLPIGPPRGALLRSAARQRQKMLVLRADSHDQATIERVARAVPALDLLFIDGDHSYEGVRKDYLSYERLVRPGGVIGFHDIMPGPEEAVGGVPSFWQELKPDHESYEFVAQQDQEGFGIGVITKP
jgi:predicted O-methyltransferase YrrM